VTLAEFLLVRIAEDEDVARRAAFGWGEGWTSKMNGEWGTVHADGKRNMVGCEDGDVTRHIAIHDPARVLAECEAKRRLVAAHEVNCIGVHTWPFTDLEIRADRAGVDVGLWAAIGYSALPYADHPDYLPEWKP
jgi:hypothetical protein